MKPQQTAPIWDTHYTWKCRKHIPVPLTCPAFFEQCPSCKQLRPSESLRPSRIPEEVKPEVVKPVEVKPKHLTLVSAPEPVAVVEPKKAEPKKAASGKVHCPGPKCRKQARSTSPYCSKICSDRCLRLRKKFTKTILSEVEVKNLNVILAALKQWEE